MPTAASTTQHPLVPDESRLPIDPSTDVPDGYSARVSVISPNGFTGDPDVMDTWATSSVTPEIAGGWLDDPDLFARVFPMDLRPQAHDIIRTWLFDTVLRSHLEHDSLPWAHTAISGFVVDPDRKKMSKSKGNVVTPMALLEEHGSDGVRYWAASGRPGTDTTFDPGQMKVGRRLAMKLLNASRFALMAAEPRGPITEPLDRGMLTALAALVEECDDAVSRQYDYARVLERTETFFWNFCDDYLELVKSRRYGDFGPEAAASANSAMLVALSTLLRLFAPYLPFVTEEVWSWWQPGFDSPGVVADGGGGRRADWRAPIAGARGTRGDRGGARRRATHQVDPEEADQGGDRARPCCRQRSRVLEPAARDFQAATHIRELHFGDVAESQLTFEDRAAPRPARESGSVRAARPRRVSGAGAATRWPRTSAGGDITTEATVERGAAGARGDPRQVALRASPGSTSRRRRSGSSIRPSRSPSHHQRRHVVRAGNGRRRVRGRAAALLTAERTALNFLQRLSGIATLDTAGSSTRPPAGSRCSTRARRRRCCARWRSTRCAPAAAVNHRHGLTTAF